MLSAVILSRHSYGAVPLVRQPPDQRSVHFGPLVASGDWRLEAGDWKIQNSTTRNHLSDIPRFLGAQTISSTLETRDWRLGPRKCKRIIQPLVPSIQSPVLAACYPYELSVSRTDSSTYGSGARAPQSLRGHNLEARNRKLESGGKIALRFRRTSSF